MIFGNYWGDDQIVLVNVYENDLIPQAIWKNSPGAPGFIAAVYDQGNILIEFLFVEIVPNTENDEEFLNLDTGQFERGVCVKVNIFTGYSTNFKTMVKVADDTWPLSWFKLDKVPPIPENPYDAYTRAMAIIGG